MKSKDILKVPISELGLSRDFYKGCQEMDIEKLEDIVLILPEELVHRKGFSYRWLGELSTYLNSHKLLYLLQPLPGKNYG